MTNLIPKRGFQLKNAVIIVKPWEKHFLDFSSEAENALVENCLIIQQTWKEWIISLFFEKVEVSR